MGLSLTRATWMKATICLQLQICFHPFALPWFRMSEWFASALEYADMLIKWHWFLVDTLIFLPKTRLFLHGNTEKFLKFPYIFNVIFHLTLIFFVCWFRAANFSYGFLRKSGHAHCSMFFFQQNPLLAFGRTVLWKWLIVYPYKLHILVRLSQYKRFFRFDFLK